MGIQSLPFPSADGYFSYFSIEFLTSFPRLGYTSPLPPKSYVLYPVVLWSGAVSFGSAFSGFIGHGPAAAWAYGDILFVQYPDCLRLVIFPEPS